MTQLYVGNLSADGDEKAIRALFSKYGVVREVLMKNGYAFVEYEDAYSAEEAMRALNGTDILGHPMIVEPSHQQRLSSRRKPPCGRVEVVVIPPQMTLQAIETLLSQFGPVIKMEIEEGEYGMRKIIATFETQECAQRAAATYGDDHCSPRILYVEENRLNGTRNGRKGSPGIPGSPSKSNSDFPLRILVPSDMVGAIIGKDGATIRMITQLTKARVDVHRRENMGSAEKVCTNPITIIGPPECCTEACFQIMKIMQNELLMTSGMLENGKFHEPLPVVPLKVLAHNELVGRVIGKGGNTLKRIMCESGTKITISKLKDLTAYNMERTITILGTIDNCKKAESLISAKLRASYESDMAQFIPVSDQTQGVYPQPPNLSPSPTNLPPTIPSPNPLSSDLTTRLHHHHHHTHSLPATPTSVRTFTDFSGEHKRLTTLHGSTGALEVSNLGGFKLGSAITVNGGGSGGGQGLNNGKFSGAFELSIDGFVKNGVLGGVPTTPIPEFVPMVNGIRGNGGGTNGISKTSPPNPLHAPISEVDEEISDVFTTFSVKDPLIAAPGYGRGRSRRSSAPVNPQYWSPGDPTMVGEIGGRGGGDLGLGNLPGNRNFSSGTISGFSGWNPPPPPPPSLAPTTPATVPNSQPTSVSSIWYSGFPSAITTSQSSRPDSQTSSHSNSSEQGSSLSAFSPIYSPTTTNDFFLHEVGTSSLLAPNPVATSVSMAEQQGPPAFKTITSIIPEEDDLLTTATSTALALGQGFIGESPLPTSISLATPW